MAGPDSILSILWNKWHRQEASETEIQQLWTLLQDPAQEKALIALLKDQYEQTRADAFFTNAEKRRLFETATQPWAQKNAGQYQPVEEETPAGYPHKRIWLRSLRIAAACILLLGIAYFLLQLFFSQKINPVDIVLSDIPAPQTQQATLSFANGDATITLKDSGSGLVGQQRGIQLVRQKDGRLTLQGNGDQIVLSTLSVPKGSKPIHLELADGSEVWVNAGSSLRFPNRFSGIERKVSLQGEAYFEVTHLANKPFLVAQGNNTIRVLGTHFNVNGYLDEPTVKVTLLEGKVAVNRALTIHPGQQAIIHQDKQVTLNARPDLEEAMAWKNNEFIFDRADIPTILRQLSRWYDLEVIYTNDIPTGHYSGSISRDNSLAQVLRILESGGVRFKINKQQLIVL